MFCALRLQQKRGWTHFIRLCTNGWQEQDSFTNTIPMILSLWTFRPVPKIASTSQRWSSGVQTEISAWRSTTEDTPQPTFVPPTQHTLTGFFDRAPGCCSVCGCTLRQMRPIPLPSTEPPRSKPNREKVEGRARQLQSHSHLPEQGPTDGSCSKIPPHPPSNRQARRQCICWTHFPEFRTVIW